jgi:hypothetical protein
MRGEGGQTNCARQHRLITLKADERDYRAPGPVSIEEKTFRHTAPLASVTVVSSTAAIWSDLNSNAWASSESFISSKTFVPWLILVTGTCASFSSPSSEVSVALQSALAGPSQMILTQPSRED